MPNALHISSSVMLHSSSKSRISRVWFTGLQRFFPLMWLSPIAISSWRRSCPCNSINSTLLKSLSVNTPTSIPCWNCSYRYFNVAVRRLPSMTTKLSPKGRTWIGSWRSTPFVLKLSIRSNMFSLFLPLRNSVVRCCIRSSAICSSDTNLYSGRSMNLLHS